MVNNITYKNLKTYSHNFNKQKTNKVLKNVNTKSHFKNLVLKSDYQQNKKQVFKKVINVESAITDQQNSGRCWLFAFLNIIRFKMIQKYNLLPSFEFSQNYLFFYDKLEKANYYLNFILENYSVDLETLNYNTDTIKVIHMLQNLTDDGGHWNVFVNLIEKYGIIPKSNMDEDFHSSNSSELETFYDDYLRKCAHKIKTTSKNDLAKNKQKLLDEMLSECYKILVLFLGEPPSIITWEYYEKNEKKEKSQSLKAKVIANVTPLEFYKKYVPYNARDKICLINYPCKQVPFYKLYNVEMTFNIIGNSEQNFINVPINIMIDAVKNSIDNEEAVWTGVDFDKYISLKDGFLDKDGFDYENVFGFSNTMKKCDALNYRQSSPTHAVVIKGYNFENSKTNGFLVENSWGEKSGFKGNYYMANSWFEDYTYEVVVDKKCVSPKILSILNQKPIVLPYWSPFSVVLVGRR
jgi:bleomycin hydrolase